MNDQLATSYSELADILNNLPMLLRETCRARGISQNLAAQQIGIAQSTVSRIISRAGDVNLENAIYILAWLDQREHSCTEQGKHPCCVKVDSSVQ